MEFKIGSGFACLGIGVAIGQWLIPPDQLAVEIRYILICVAFLLFVGGGYLILHSLWKHHKPRQVKGHTVNKMGSLIVWVICGACLGGLAWYATNFSGAMRTSSNDYEQSGPIRWNFSSPNYPLHVFTNHVRSSSQVHSFHVVGKNTSDKPIKHIKGYVRSERTNVEYPIFMDLTGDLVRPEDTLGIPSNSEFSLKAPFPDESSDRPGIEVERFIADFPALTFVVEYDGHTFTRHFSGDEIEGRIIEIRRLHRKHASNQATVIRRQGD